MGEFFRPQKHAAAFLEPESISFGGRRLFATNYVDIFKNGV